MNSNFQKLFIWGNPHHILRMSSYIFDEKIKETVDVLITSCDQKLLTKEMFILLKRRLSNGTSLSPQSSITVSETSVVFN